MKNTALTHIARLQKIGEAIESMVRDEELSKIKPTKAEEIFFKTYEEMIFVGYSEKTLNEFARRYIEIKTAHYKTYLWEQCKKEMPESD